MAFSKSELRKGSDFYDEDVNVCKPCSVAGKQVDAKSYCADCREFLCQQCSSYHSTLTINKDHALANADRATKTTPAVTKDKCSKTCTVHKGKTVKYYCQSHSHFGCSICITNELKKCSNVDHIPSVAADIKGHENFKMFDKGLKDLGAACKEGIADVKRSLQKIQDDERELKDAFKAFKKEMKDALDKLESETLDQVKKIRTTESRKLDTLSKKLEKQQGDVDLMMKEVVDLLFRSKNCDVYVLVQTGMERLTSLRDDLASTAQDTTYQRFAFHPNKDVLKAGALGKLNKREGMLMFQLKRRNTDMIRAKNKRPRAVSHEDLRTTKEPSSSPKSPPSKLPFLVELNQDGSENLKGKVVRLHLDVTEVGREKSMSSSGQHLQLMGPNILPRHCVIGHSSGIVTVTPTSRDSETYVNNQSIYETTVLQHGMNVRFGKANAFRFFDPSWEERQRKSQMPPALQASAPPQFAGRPRRVSRRVSEMSFETDGRVEMSDGLRPPHPQRQESRQSGHSSSAHGSHDEPPRASPRDVSRPDGMKFEDSLPASLEFRDERENDFLVSVILDSNASATQFNLSPTYTLYLAVRYRLSSSYKPDMSPTDRAHKLTSFVNKIAEMSHQAIQANCDNPAALAFWMANASEILHFLKQDRELHLFSADSQEMLAEAVQMAFHHLVRCLQYDLQKTLPAFLDENDDSDDMDEWSRFNRNKPTMLDILDTLASAMNLLRRCRVNAALAIQLFSQLFHFINMWVFNILVTEKRLNLCTRVWGIRLKRRLGRVEAWAEKQGLGLAADCHLCRIIQAAHLLQAPKSSPDDIANISSTCFKLNSLQLRELLERYTPEPMEPPIPHNLIDRVVSVAENMADDLIRSDGRTVQLEEDQDLQWPFLLPEDGYSCDTIKGVPNGLPEYIEPMTRAGICRMSLQPQSSGLWTVYMTDDEASQIMEDGGPGGLGTVQGPFERFGPGRYVVRRDASERIYNHRMGADGCYDLEIV